MAAITLRDVHKRYRIYRQRYQSIKEVLVHRRLGEWEDHWALRGLDLDIRPGTTVGLIGPNGAGKSTTLKLMARILAPDRGTVSIGGRVSGLLELGAGFQLEYSGRENIYLNASLLGLKRREIDSRLEAILDFSELEPYIEDPLRTYSSGMYMRLAFAIAIHVDPEILLVDEILAVGDISFQRKCLDHISGLQAAGGTIVLISHNLGQIQEMCDEVAWIENGVLQGIGPATPVINRYIDRVRETDRAAREESRAAEAGARPRPRVELGEVRLLDRQGKPAEVVALGDPLLVEIPYCAHHSVATPKFGVALFRNDGVYMYGTNTAIDGVEVGPLEGEGVVRLRYSGLPLLAGTYRLSIGVYESEAADAPLDFHDKLHSFRIATTSTEEGLLRFDHQWEVPTQVRGHRRHAG